MTDFERSLVKSFNRFFESRKIRGIAYRRKQHRFSSQFVDILVDSFNPDFYLAIENKSLKTSSADKLYFSQHFSKTDEGHQVERIDDFVHRSGRKGFLAVELRRGTGRPRKAYMIPWNEVMERFENGGKGFSVEEIKDFPEIKRNSTNYKIRQTMEMVK